MFTGLVQHLARFRSLQISGVSARLFVDFPRLPSPVPGESIAVNGVCLSLVSATASTLAFDLLRETLSRTSFPAKRPGDPLHLERALRAGDALGGHFVTGHVDAVATLLSVSPPTPSGDRVLRLRLPPDLFPNLLPKGSVALDGVSLTLVDLRPADSSFTVHLIPLTWAHTAFSSLRPGDPVNVETDLLAKAARAATAPSSSPAAPPPSVTLERLRSAGF